MEFGIQPQIPNSGLQILNSNPLVTIKSPQEIKLLQEGGKILAEVLREVQKAITSGVTTRYIDGLCEKLILSYGAKPSFKGYRPEDAKKPYPAATCISINHVVVHQPPSEYIIREGDVVKIDAGLIYKGLYTDSAVTVGIGNIGKEARQLIETVKKSLHEGIKHARAGNAIGDIGYAVDRCVKRKGFVVIRNLTGHGVGYAVHEDPVILNYGKPGSGIRLQEGMVIAIEPMASISSGTVIQLPDDSYATHDNSLSAHFEHTVAVTDKGPLVLTV